MTNSEKIQILKDNIKSLIINLKIDDENYLFNFAKQQAKEMQIEITKGELKVIVNNIISIAQAEEYYKNSIFEDNLSPLELKEIENENYSI